MRGDREQQNMNPRDIQVPTIGADAIILTNKAIFTMNGFCPRCEVKTRRQGVHLQARCGQQRGYRHWYIDKLRFCIVCEKYYITAAALSKQNQRIKTKFGVSNFIWPSNLEEIHVGRNGIPCYITYSRVDEGMVEAQGCRELFYDMSEEERYFADDPVLYIHKGTIFCETRCHEVEQATAIMTDINGNDAKLNVSHCLTCGRYFMSYSVFQLYQRRFRAILGDLELWDDEPRCGGDYCLAEESRLHLYGYNVDKRMDLSQGERQRIIAMVIGNDLISKREVINLLRSFIERSKNRENYGQSVRKWEEDLEFTLGIDIDEQPRYGLEQLERYRRNRYVRRRLQPAGNCGDS